jgi:site-specific recombinase XerC
MTPTIQLDVTGRTRSPATIRGITSAASRPTRAGAIRQTRPASKRFVAVMRAAGEGPHGLWMRGLIPLLWRAGLRISEALMVAEADLEPLRGSLLVRHGKGGKRREVGMDDWGWEHLRPWLEHRVALPVGTLFCAIKRSDRRTAMGALAASTDAKAGGQAGVWRESHRISFVTPTPSRWPARACLST